MKNNNGKFLILLGLLLIVAALCLTTYNLHDGLRAARSASQVVSQLESRVPMLTVPIQVPVTPEPTISTEITPPDYVLNPEMEMPVELIDGIAYIGIVRIPALDLELPVIENWSYPALKVAPCRYTGSAYLDDLVIAAHNYQAHFGKLKTLLPGETITFTDMDGNVFSYEVVAVETLPPTAIEEMTDAGYDLTLFTCTLGGASRVTVRCDRVDSRPASQ